MSTESKNFLGIDWGSSDIGIAIADPETRIALALTTLQNDRMLLQRLCGIIEKEGIGTVVIGVPSHVNRKVVEYEGERLGKALAKLVPEVVVVYQDEMFTTKMAQANLIERGVKQVSKHDDEEAARIILQQWLDRA